MTWGGWITMILSISVVTALLAWCVYKVLSTPGESEKIHGFERNEQENPEFGEDERPRTDSGSDD